MSAYTVIGDEPPGLYSFDNLTKANYNYREFLKTCGKTIIPLMNLGWDPRPRLADQEWAKYYLESPSYMVPTPEEIANHLQNNLNWMQINQPQEVNKFILVNSLNEYDESGITLSKLMQQGYAYLDVFRQILVTQPAQISIG